MNLYKQQLEMTETNNDAWSQNWQQ